jgi:glycosyltransferase involved in cell wall biosynthesis
VVIASPAFTDTSWLVRHGVEHVETDPRESPVQSAQRVLNALTDYRIDGVINNDNAVLQSIAPLCSVPFVSIMHLPKHAIGALAAYNAAYVDYVVAISPDMQRIAIENYGLPISKVPLIYNGVPDVEMAERSRAGGAPLHVVFAGGGNHRKGADLMLQLAQQLQVKEQQLVLHWFDVLPPLMQRKLAGLSFIKTYGRVRADEFMNRLSSADVLMMPSRMEGCPMVLLEAMCRGVVPIVGDGLGAMRWIVQSGHNGFVCSLRRWSSEADECLRHLSEQRRVVQDMSRHARQTYVTSFTSNRMAEAMRGLRLRPTVARQQLLREVPLLKWTRPVAKPGPRVGLWERVCYRAGWLRPAATMSTS